MLDKLNKAIEQCNDEEILSLLVDAYEDIRAIHEQREEYTQQIAMAIDECKKQVAEYQNAIDESYDYELTLYNAVLNYL